MLYITSDLLFTIFPSVDESTGRLRGAVACFSWASGRVLGTTRSEAKPHGSRRRSLRFWPEHAGGGVRQPDLSLLSSLCHLALQITYQNSLNIQFQERYAEPAQGRITDGVRGTTHEFRRSPSSSCQRNRRRKFEPCEYAVEPFQTASNQTVRR